MKYALDTRLTSYGDAGFSRFLRRAFLASAGFDENDLDSVDVKALERDRERWHDRSSSQQASDPERNIAQKNFTVIQKRVERVHEIGRYLGVTRAQLDLIENSFQLIADQIVTMQSPNELSGQLDDLLDGVDSIRQTAIDTEKLLNNLERA